MLQESIEKDPDNIYLKHDLDIAIEKRKEIVDAALPELHLRINTGETRTPTPALPPLFPSSSSEEVEPVIIPPPEPLPEPPKEPEPPPPPPPPPEPEPEKEKEDDGSNLYNNNIADDAMIKEEDIPLTALDVLIKEWRIKAHQSPPEGMTKAQIASFAKYAKVFGLFFIIYLNSQNCNLNSGCIEILEDNLNVIADKYTPVELYKYLYEIMLTPLRSPVPSLFQRAVIFCDDLFRNEVKSIDINKIYKNEVNKGINEVLAIIVDRISDHNEEIKETANEFLGKFARLDNAFFEMSIEMILNVMKKEKESVDVENLCERVRMLSILLEKKTDPDLFKRSNIEEFIVNYCKSFDNEELLVLISDLFGKYYPSVVRKSDDPKGKKKSDKKDNKKDNKKNDGDKETPGEVKDEDPNTVKHSKACHLL